MLDSEYSSSSSSDDNEITGGDSSLETEFIELEETSMGFVYVVIGL